MNTKQKVKHWLKNYPDLRDNDNRLFSNIWAKELKQRGFNLFELNAVELLKMLASNELTSAPSIKRARAKLQEECPEYRGNKYTIRKGILQDKWREKLGYPNG